MEETSSIFRRPEYEEQKMLVKGLTEINKEKRRNFLINASIWGFLLVLIVGILLGTAGKDPSRDVKRYTGAKPSFEEYEDYIMSGIFTAQTDPSSIELVQSADISSMEYIPFLMNRNVTYSIRIAPEDYDYESLDFNQIDKKNKTFYIGSGYPLPKESKSYKEAAQKAKELFDEEINKRAALGRKIELKHLAIILTICAIYIIAMVIWGKQLKMIREKRIMDIKHGKVSVADGILIGRERIRRYRNSDSFSVEAVTENQQKFTIRVKLLQYDCFESNTPCLLVKYDEGDGSYDEYDIVWEKLGYFGT